MNPRVKNVKPNSDFTITLWFTNGEVRRFDVKPYLNKGFFQELQEPNVFNTVKPFLGSVQWKSGQDFCPDTLYEESVKVLSKQKITSRKNMQMRQSAKMKTKSTD